VFDNTGSRKWCWIKRYSMYILIIFDWHAESQACTKIAKLFSVLQNRYIANNMVLSVHWEKNIKTQCFNFHTNRIYIYTPTLDWDSKKNRKSIRYRARSWLNVIDGKDTRKSYKHIKCYVMMRINSLSSVRVMLCHQVSDTERHSSGTFYL
jgi:hypothetical protein